MARVWARIASLALAALLALAIGSVVRAHARTLGEIIDDARITAEVMTRLTAESPSNFVKIDVKSESGVVTLSGTVDSVEKRSRAAQITGAVSGVKGLVNNIQVAGAAPRLRAPHARAARARRRARDPAGAHAVRLARHDDDEHATDAGHGRGARCRRRERHVEPVREQPLTTQRALAFRSARSQPA